MQNSTALKFVPVITEDKKVELAVENDQAVIKLSTWVEDLGWCGQKTLSLDAEMLDDLHRLIAAARVRLKKEKSKEILDEAPSKVLQFPRFV